MAGVRPRGSPAAVGAAPRFALVATRRRKQVLLLAAILFGFASAAVAAPAEGARSPLAQSEDTVALAERYENGESVRQDYHAALALYCRAAERGDPKAAFHLGWMYLNGRGVARSDATAVMWLRKAAGGGVPQAANLLTLLAGVPSAPMRGCPGGGALGVSLAHAPPEIRALADETALHVGINPQLLLSVMAVESGFNPRALSPKAAAGLMQLMPQTAARFGVGDRFDPRDNLRGGAAYLRSLITMFDGNLTLALAAYNAGEATVLAHGAVPPYPETINYVAAVKRLCACGQ